MKLQNTLTVMIAEFYRDFVQATKQELKKLGLSYGQISFLIYIGKHPGCTQSNLTGALRIDWGHSQRSIAKLVSDGFLTKAYDETVGGNCLRLTKRGEEALEVIHSAFYDWDACMMEALSESEQEVLFTLLGKIVRKREEERDRT